MVCLSLSSVIGILSLLVIFSKNFLRCRVSNSRVQHTTLKVMVKLKWLIAFWNKISIFLATNSPVVGILFYLGSSSNIIWPIILLSKWLPFRHYMVDLRLLFLLIIQVLLWWMKLMFNWPTAMSYYNNSKLIYRMQMIACTNRPIPSAKTLSFKRLIGSFLNYSPIGNTPSSKWLFKSSHIAFIEFFKSFSELDR